MLFVDILKKYENPINESFDKLVETALSNQSHPGDMLIWVENGFYNEDVLKFKGRNNMTLNPHVVGPGEIGHSESAHYRFIHQYRQAYLSDIPYADYITKHEYSPERREEIEKLVEFEESTINLEMLVYLKFWESDSILKKLYELVRIANSETYDWYFKIAESNRDPDATGTRQDIVRKMIRDRIKDKCPDLYEAIKFSYKTQIRNAIAHSKYSFQQRNIHLHNFIEQDQHSQISNIPFDEWIEIFHKTILIHNQYIHAHNRVREHYKRLAEQSDNLFPILITEKSGKQYEFPLQFRPDAGFWGYYQGQ
jgi:hypothetical protein